MMYAILIFVMFVVVIWVLWRLSSNRWELPCPPWLGWLVEINNPFTKANRADFIIKHLNLKASMNVLDVGCGPGRVTIPIAKKIGPRGKVTAMDIQLEMLDRTRKKAQIANLHNIEFLPAKIGDGKLKCNKYDRVLLATVLGEIPDRKSALKEIFKTLKPGGVLAVTESIFDPHFQRKNVVINLGKEAGFNVEKVLGNFLAFALLLKKPS